MVKQYRERVIRKLRENGHKLTPQRIAIVNYLGSKNNHPSVDKIHKDLARDYPNMALATVYNTLDMLKNIGEVRELNFGADRKRFEAMGEPHQHALCEHCGDVSDVFEKSSSLVNIPPELAKKFNVRDASVIYMGACKDCN